MAQATNDPLATELQNQLGELKAERLTSLNEAADIHVALQAALLNEAQRLETRLGADHVRTQLLRNRAQANAQVTQTLQIESQVVQFNLPEMDPEGALVYGRIVDEDGLGFDRLIVRLVDVSGAPIDIGGAASDDSGGFVIALDSQTVDRVVKGSPQGVLPTVSTPRGRVVYTQSKPVAIAHGARLRIDISLNRTDWSAVPAPPSPPPTPPPTEPAAVVPELIGKTEKEALSLLKKANLKVGKSETKFAPDRVGVVLDQSPAAGLSIAPGSPVNLVVGGGDTVAVPDLVGGNLRTAKARLKTAELTLGQVSGIAPSDASIVEKQSPAAGASVARGAAVDVTVGGTGTPRPTGRKK